MADIKITQVDWFDDRYYRLDLDDKAVRYIASVTTKLSIEKKWALEEWRATVGIERANEKMNEASERGKRLHWALQAYLTGGAVLYNNWQAPIYSEADIEAIKKEHNGNVFILKNQDEMNQIYKVQQFYDIVKPKVIQTELTVYDLEEDIAGTLDGALFIEKGTYPVNGSKGLVIPESGIYVYDFKSGRTFDDSFWNQIAPYVHCYEKLGHGKVAGALVLHTGSDNRSGIAGFAAKLKMRADLNHDMDVYRLIANLWDERNPNAGPKILKFPSLIKRSDLNV